MELEQLYKSYKDYKCKIEGKSENSVNQYIYRIQDFIKYNNIKNVDDLISMTSNNVKLWLSSLADNGNAERSRNTKLTAVKEIYKYLDEDLKMEVDTDIQRIPFAKVPKRESKCLSSEDVKDLIDFIRDSRTRTAVAIIFQTGVRFCELIQITCTDIERGYADIIGKGNKERTIWFDLWVQEIARKYINGKRRKIVEKQQVNTDILMISDWGNVILRENLEKSMKKWAKDFNEYPLTKGRLEWWEHFSPHKLRHSFASYQFEQGVDAATVRDSMGHSNLATTNNYSHSTQNRVKMAMLGQKAKENHEDMELIKKLLADKDLLSKVKEMIGEDNKDE